MAVVGAAGVAHRRESALQTGLQKLPRVLAQQLSDHPEYRDTIDADYVRTIYLTSPLHDIGKVAIPDAILRKPGPLTLESAGLPLPDWPVRPSVWPMPRAAPLISATLPANLMQ